MKLLVLLAAELIAAGPTGAFAADDQCDIGGASRHIELPPGTESINGVLERKVETPVCWSIRQNDGSLTQQVFFRGLAGGPTPGPVVTLRQFCQGDQCKIVGTMVFALWAHRQENLHYRIYGYMRDSSGPVELYSLDSGATHIDCHSDGRTEINLLNNPRDWHQDPETSREIFQSVSEIVIHLDRDDREEAGCEARKLSVWHDFTATVAKAAQDAYDNVRGKYLNNAPPEAGTRTTTTTPARGPATYGPYGYLDCVGPAGPDIAPKSVTCYSGIGGKTWLVCTGREGQTGKGTWTDSGIPCNLPGPLPN